jgi:glutamate synthase (NADPH/NADH) large chain
VSAAGVVPSLIDERFDHDSCGVGFVASVDGSPSHTILQKALTALSRLAHRGATAADGKSSDGVGVMTAIPRELLVKATNLAIGEKQLLGVGMLLLPVEETRAEGLLERCLLSHDFRVLCWRDVPVCTEWLGETALATMPKIRQVQVVDSGAGEPETMERRLYLARKQFERAHAQSDVTGYICSLSSQTIVYKAMCTGEFLPNFYPDLASDDYVTPFAVFHQRYATNTSPTWHRVQPGRKLGHNGEINTVWGNRAQVWMKRLSCYRRTEEVWRRPSACCSHQQRTGITLLRFCDIPRIALNHGTGRRRSRSATAKWLALCWIVTGSGHAVLR